MRKPIKGKTSSYFVCKVSTNCSLHHHSLSSNWNEAATSVLQEPTCREHQLSSFQHQLDGSYNFHMYKHQLVQKTYSLPLLHPTTLILWLQPEGSCNFLCSSTNLNHENNSSPLLLPTTLLILLCHWEPAHKFFIFFVKDKYLNHLCPNIHIRFYFWQKTTIFVCLCILLDDSKTSCA